MARAQNYINGTWKNGSLGTLDMINPSYDLKLGEIARSNKKDVDEAVKAARDAFEGDWRQTEAAERGRLLHQISDILKDQIDELADTESKDTGKPLSQAKADAALIARYFEFYAGAADKLHGETIPYKNGYTVYTQRVPYGVTGHIIPWNYPLQMTGRTLAPSLAAGNSVIFKPAEDACLAVVRVFELIEDVEFPPGAINLLTGTGEEVGSALANHPEIDKLSFTGSPQVGSQVMKQSADHIRPVVLELGGKSPQVVFEDADLEEALPVIVNAIIQNAGQTCSAGSRLVIQESIYDQFVERLVDRFNSIKMGPADQDPDIGPIINKKQFNRVEEYVNRALDDGAEILAQSEKFEGSGYFYPPTLLGKVDNSSFIGQNEVFGPVLSVITFDDEKEGIRIANDVEYGLVASVWTRDNGKAHRVANALRAGQVYVNGYGAGGGVELPFGGLKKSGFGREKGFEAMHDFTTIKTTIINHGS